MNIHTKFKAILCYGLGEVETSKKIHDDGRFEWSLHWKAPRSPNPPTKKVDQEGISIMADLIVLTQLIFYIMMKTSFLEKMIICLFVCNVSFKHLRSYGDGAYL